MQPSGAAGSLRCDPSIRSPFPEDPVRSLTLTAAALLVSTAATAQSVRALRTGTRALLARANEIASPGAPPRQRSRPARECSC